MPVAGQGGSKGACPVRQEREAMHKSFRSCARSSSMAVFGFLLMVVPLLKAQNVTTPAESKADLPDAPMPVTTASPTQNNKSFMPGATRPSFGANHTQARSWMVKSPAFDRSRFNTNAFAYKDSRPDGKDMKAASRPPATRFSFDPIGGHKNRAVTHDDTQWYT